MRRTPWFLLSAAVHLGALLLLADLTTEWAPREETSTGVFEVRLVAEEPPSPEPTPEPEMPKAEEPPEESPPEEETMPPKAGPDPPAPPAEETAPEPQPAARQLPPVVGVPGPEQPVHDAFAARMAEAREQALRERGGSPASEKAVDAGLEWLSRRQEGDTGRWTDGDPQLKLAPALTGLALLAFLGKGHTHTDSGPYRDTVARGIAWLLGIQTAHGRFGGPYLVRGETNNRYLMYHQAIATLALAEAYALSHDPKLRGPVRRAVAFIERAQQPGGGWDYGDARTNRNDTSVTGWQLMALKSAHDAGIEVQWQTLFGAMRHLDTHTRPGGEVVYADRPPPRVYWRRGPGMVAVGLLSRQLLGWPRRSPLHALQADYILRHPPDWSTMNANDPNDLDSYLHTMYYWYYAALALFHTGGRWWREWNSQSRDMLIAHQVNHGERRGSWDPPNRGFDSAGGRVYATAINVLNLEIYYRYLPLYQGGGFDAVGVLERAARVRGHGGMRARALELLAGFPGKRARAILVEALDDPSAAARAAARRALVEQRAEVVVPALLADLEASRDAVRASALDGLLELGGSRFVPQFLDALEDEALMVRAKAMVAVREVAGQKLGFRPDAEPEKRQRAIERWRRWWKGQDLVAASGGLRGGVLVVEPREPDSVVLNLGSEDGVRRSMRFEVLRGGERIALLAAERVEATLTVARVVEQGEQAIEEGDVVRCLSDLEVSRAQD
ncbi:MAG: hypothetical protein ACLF0G_01905 [Candidatus Brocadiia bacterium]